MYCWNISNLLETTNPGSIARGLMSNSNGDWCSDLGRHLLLRRRAGSRTSSSCSASTKSCTSMLMSTSRCDQTADGLAIRFTSLAAAGTRAITREMRPHTRILGATLLADVGSSKATSDPGNRLHPPPRQPPSRRRRPLPASDELSARQRRARDGIGGAGADGQVPARRCFRVLAHDGHVRISRNLRSCTAVGRRVRHHPARVPRRDPGQQAHAAGASPRACTVHIPRAPLGAGSLIAARGAFDVEVLEGPHATEGEHRGLAPWPRSAAPGRAARAARTWRRCA